MVLLPWPVTRYRFILHYSFVIDYWQYVEEIIKMDKSPRQYQTALLSGTNTIVSEKNITTEVLFFDIILCVISIILYRKLSWSIWWYENNMIFLSIIFQIIERPAFSGYWSSSKSYCLLFSVSWRNCDCGYRHDDSKTDCSRIHARIRFTSPVFSLVQLCYWWLFPHCCRSRCRGCFEQCLTLFETDSAIDTIYYCCHSYYLVAMAGQIIFPMARLEW